MSYDQGEHRHEVGGGMREFIPASRLHVGSVVFVVPQDATTPRGPKLGMIPPAGADLAINDYLLGCAQRGAVRCYGPVCAPNEEGAA